MALPYRIIKHLLRIFVVFSLLWGNNAFSSREETLQPLYLWGNFSGFQESSPQAAFAAYAKPACASWDPKICFHYINLRPAYNSYTINGMTKSYIYDEVECHSDTGKCYTYANRGGIWTGNGICPEGWGLGSIVNGYSIEETCRRMIHETTPPNDCGIKNPILPATGEKYQKDTDYTTADGVLNFTRIYRSTTGVTTSDLTATLIDNTPFRFVSDQCCTGWYINKQDNSIVPYCWHYQTNATPTVDIHLPNGRVLQFMGQQPVAVGIEEKLYKNTDSMGNVTEWLLRFADNSALVFDSKGREIRRLTPNGRAVSNVYSDSTTPSTIAPRAGMLVSMKDDVGRQLNFTYNALNQLSQMQTPEGKIFSYTFDKYNNLTTVTYPDGKIRTYSYGEPANINGGLACSGVPSIYMSRLLTGITDERGIRFATYKYQCDKKAISTEHADGTEKAQLAYDYNSTTVTNEFNKKTIYRFADIAGARRVTSVEGQATANCAGANKNYNYTPEGWLQSKTDWNGNKTVYSYNTKGQEISRTEAFGTLVAKTITTEWHSLLNLKTKITEPNKETTFNYDANGLLLSQSVRSLP